MGSLLMPLLGSVAGKAGDALVGELLRAWGIDAYRRRLERHLAAVQSVLLDAEARSHTNPAVRGWMNDLRAAAYKADDVLDDFRYESLRRKAQVRGSMARKVRNFFTVNPVMFRISMSRRLKDVLEMIDELVMEMNKFHFLEHIETPSITHPQTYSHVVESDTVGKRDEKEEVINTLLNRSDNSGVMVLPIIGMGGIGKTTLAQLVYNNERVRRHFELLIWVCVSEKFVLIDLVRSIIEVTKMQKCGLPDNMELLHKELGKVLGKKKFMLVLDDVWNEDERKWDGLRSLLWSHAGSGSAIIVTSHSAKVASIMGTIPPYKISPLNDDFSWELFRRKAFQRGVEEQPKLISAAKKILEKCNGLPLAINTMAALLSSKHPSEWFSVVDSDVWTSDSNETRIALKLSFDHLSSEAKRCFSFCAVFPKDSLMMKDTLIHLWIANDFIASETIGQEIFNELVWRCFLQDVAENMSYKFYLTPATCKMHDLMHDLAESITENDCLILLKASPQNVLQVPTHGSSLMYIRHLSVDSLDNSAVMKKILAPRTILFSQQKNYSTMKNFLSMDKSKFTSLRALQTFDYQLVGRYMTHLKHLRYLDLSNTQIVALPKGTAMLYSLQTLKLFHCYELKELPEDMRYMSSLRHVFLNGCPNLKRMPAGMGELKCVQTLTNYVIGSEAGRGIDQLKDMNLLRGAICLSQLGKVQIADNAKQGNISSKHGLNILEFDWGTSPVENEVISAHTAEKVLEALHPPSRLQGLKITRYTGAKFSSWMKNSTLLEHLSKLCLEYCKNCKDLPPLWQLPSLRYLELADMGSLTSICSISNDTGDAEPCNFPLTFPKMETMLFYGLPKLERWHQEVAGQVAVVSFPQLKRLDIYKCPILASMPKLPLLQDLTVGQAERVPLHQLIDVCMQSNLGCKGSILVGSVGLQPVDLTFSVLSDSDVSLEFRGLMENVNRIEEELHMIPCRTIKKLRFRFSSDASQISETMLKHLSFVEHLAFRECSDIVQWVPEDFLRNLNCLRTLSLDSCPNLTGSLPSTSDEQDILLPQLRELSIFECENLVEIPKLPASLESLSVWICPRLVSLPVNLGNLTELRNLELSSCDNLTRFPDGIGGFTALKELTIRRCPGLETLPEGLLQQLPALECLHIEDCPNLEREFSTGGAYWDYIEAIPNVIIWSPNIHQVADVQEDVSSTTSRRAADCLSCLH